MRFLWKVWLSQYTPYLTSSPGQWATSTFPFSSKSKGPSIEDFQSYFNTVLSTIWNHQFTSFGNSEASSCLVWLWSNWEFNKESFALKWLGVSLILSCPNFYCDVSVSMQDNLTLEVLAVVTAVDKISEPAVLSAVLFYQYRILFVFKDDLLP